MEPLVKQLVANKNMWDGNRRLFLWLLQCRK